MSEEIKFVKLRNGEDLVAFITVGKSTTLIRRPVCVMVENIFEEGRQLLNIREWLPPTIVKGDSTTISSSEIIAVLDVSEEFIPQYHEICEMFFDTVPVIKNKRLKGVKASDDNKVVSIVEALAGMADKKDKPIH